MFDLLIKNGVVVDGTGAPRRPADVAIQAGRIAEIGPVGARAKNEIDARGLVVAPGFVDIHTHYDAQAFWDGTLSPSPFHGVTTVVGGNCGFSIAPLSPDAAGYLKRMLARVEGMPLESLEAGVPWDWTSFGEYLSRLDGRLAVNAGFLVGHSALRRVVMGEAAIGEPASDVALRAMQDLLRESLAQGGLGFSSSAAPTHNDSEGRPVPSRFATREEFLALARAVRDFPGTTLEFIPTVGTFSEAQQDLMASMSLAANRPLNWNVLGVASFAPKASEAQLAASDYAAARGARVIALTPSQVMKLRINLATGFIFDALPGWAAVLGLPLPERMGALRDPAVREQLQKGASSEAAGAFRAIAAWDNMTVEETFEPRNAELTGRKLGAIAKEQGKPAFDVLLDLALSEDLRTSYSPFIPGDDEASWQLRAKVWRDPRTVIGASDAGAHLDMIDTFTCSTSLLGPGVREKRLLSLEEAVHQLSDIPARLYGIRERGRLAGLARRRRRLRRGPRRARPDPHAPRPSGGSRAPLRRGRRNRARARERGRDRARQAVYRRAARYGDALRPRHGDRRGPRRPRVASEARSELKASGDHSSRESSPMQIIDADAHVVEGASFAQQALARWPELVKFHSATVGRAGFTLEGRRYPEDEGPGAGCPPQHGLSKAEGISPFTVEGMLADADKEGIDRMVLYPSMGLAAPSLRDPRFAAEFSALYNEFIADWCKRSGGRLYGVAAVPIEDVQTSVQMMAEAKRLGLVATLVPPALRERNLDHPDLDPFYAAAADLDMPLGVHGAPGIHLPKIGVDRFTNYIQVHCVSFPFDQMTAMTALVSGGVFDRHPRLRVAFLEAGVTWVPYFIDRLHEHWEKRGSWIPNGWQRDPREYVERGQIYVSCEPDETVLPAVIDALGPDFVMYASDYPHWDGEFPESTHALRTRTDISEPARRKLLAENARRFYGLA